MIYAICAYEKMYGGQKGICDNFICEFSSPAIAETIAIRHSYKLMSHSSFIQDFFEKELEAEGFEFHSDDWWDRLYEKEAKNVAYDIYEVRSQRGKSIEELKDEFLDNKELFIKTYCS